MSVRRVLALALAAAVWIVAIVLLWRTRVPSGLDVPAIDVHRYFTAAELRRAERYGRVSGSLFVLSQLALVAVLAAYARWGGRFARESAAGRIGTGMLLGMLGLAIAWIAEVPFTVAQLWWERRHGLLKVDYFTAIFGGWLALSGAFLSICLALVIVMGLARWLRERWWIAGAPVFIGIALLFAFVYPYLIETRPLENPGLAADARRFLRAEGVPRTPVRVEEVHTFTSAPNAEAAGLGVSRRIILWDTLTDGRFSDGEIRIVLAHEVAHLAREHIWRSLAWYALFAFPGAYLIARLTRRRGGMADPAAVPLSLFLLVALNLLAMPLQNTIVRHLEAEADWMALERTQDPASARKLFHRFTTTTLDEPSPSTLEYLLLENHPTIAQRIAMANAWEARRRAQATSAAQSP
ncbi:MAG: M48 family metalloprotease [Actinomycetota bacterium]|nr:M48 family metalloprotease [Actinomycetota bacterium]